MRILDTERQSSRIFTGNRSRSASPSSPTVKTTPFAFDVTALQRKASCACGGGCPRCLETTGHEFIQAKLKVSTPGDKYEREADQVAEQVLRMPDQALLSRTANRDLALPLIQRVDSGSYPHLQREEVIETPLPEEEEEEPVVQTKEKPGYVSKASTAVGPTLASMKNGGQPLPESARAFFEPRFGYDFGHVRIHTNSQAAETAAAVNARAFTVGRDIVFGAGQYAPESASGKLLLAHELSHVVQQANTIGRLFRKIEYPAPRYTSTHATDTFLAGGDGALTTPTVNGIPFPDVVNDAGNIIFKAFRLDANGAAIKTVGEEFVCSYDEPVVNISANIRLVAAPERNRWTGQTRGSNFAGRNQACRDKGNIPVEARGDPDASTIYEKMRSNEKEHYDDLKALSGTHLGRLLTLLRGFKDKTAVNDQECEQRLSDSVSRKAAEIILAFLQAVLAKVRERDVRPGPHLFIPHITVAGDCSRITILVNQRTSR